MPLINCEIELELRWAKNCVISQISRAPAVDGNPNADPPVPAVAATQMILRDSFDKHYIPLAEIKEFNALIDNKPIFDQPVKNKQEAYEKLIEMSRNDITIGTLLDYLYLQKYYKLIGIEVKICSLVCSEFIIQ